MPCSGSLVRISVHASAARSRGRNRVDSRQVEQVAQFILSPIRLAATIGGDVVIEMGRINGQYSIILRSNESIHIS